MAVFVDRLARDEALLARLRDRVGDRQGDEAILAMIDLAARYDFQILFVEVRALRERIVMDSRGYGRDAGKISAEVSDSLPSGLVDLMRRW